MTTVRAHCTICGDVDLTIDQLGVTVCETTSVGEYAFECPQCSHSVRREVNNRLIDLLVAAGVTLTTWSWPEPMLEIPSGPPIDHDELLAFHRLLEDDDAIADAIDRLRQGTELR